jgi:hypothetical protein
LDNAGESLLFDSIAVKNILPVFELGPTSQRQEEAAPRVPKCALSSVNGFFTLLATKSLPPFAFDLFDRP